MPEVASSYAAEARVEANKCVRTASPRSVASEFRHMSELVGTTHLCCKAAEKHVSC